MAGRSVGQSPDPRSGLHLWLRRLTDPERFFTALLCTGRRWLWAAPGLSRLSSSSVISHRKQTLLQTATFQTTSVTDGPPAPLLGRARAGGLAGGQRPHLCSRESPVSLPQTVLPTVSPQVLSEPHRCGSHGEGGLPAMSFSKNGWMTSPNLDLSATASFRSCPQLTGGRGTERRPLHFK